MEKVKLLVQHMFAAVSKHVDDPAILTSIGNELRLLASKTGNVNEVGRLLQNSSDDDTTL
jgi:hypothetical protein